MKKIFTFLILIVAIFLFSACVPVNPPKPVYKMNLILNNDSMKLTSSAFAQGENLPSQFTCDGQGINPQLEIGDVPAATKSLALIFDDPDAISSTFIHWLVWNIDPQTTVIAENSVPSGAKLGTTSANRTGYVAPCPPSGAHHYVFKLYALDTMLDLTPNAGKDNLEQAMQNHILGYAELSGLYKRN
jgi:hypothetical protein